MSNEVPNTIDKIAGFLEIGINDNNEIVINHPHLDVDENGVGHIILSVHQASNLANVLNKKVFELKNNLLIDDDRGSLYSV